MGGASDAALAAVGLASTAACAAAGTPSLNYVERCRNLGVHFALTGEGSAGDRGSLNAGAGRRGWRALGGPGAASRRTY